MKSVSVFRLPIFWMLLGPPAFRITTWRSGLASLEGNQDVWNIIRVAWWSLWGLVALWELARNYTALRSFTRQLGYLPVWIGLWLTALFLSCLASPVPVFSLANVSMFVLLVLAAADLGLKLYAGQLSFQRALGYLLAFALVLLATVWVVYRTTPWVVGHVSYQGLRVRGGPIAYTPLLSLVVIFTSLYFLTTLRSAGRWLLLGSLWFGLWWLYMGQTRSAYAGLLIGLVVLVWYRSGIRYDFTRLAALGAVAGIGLCGLIFLYGESHTVTWRLDSYYRRFVLRDAYAIHNPELARASLTSLNGRTEAAAVLIDGAAGKPFGLGYIAGVRTYMSREDVLERLPSDAFLGAHNTYLETWAGGGYLSLLAYLALILWIVWRSRRLRATVAIPFRILLYVVLFEGFFENELAFPFHQSPVVFWVAAAAVAALTAESPGNLFARSSPPAQLPVTTVS